MTTGGGVRLGVWLSLASAALAGCAGPEPPTSLPPSFAQPRAAASALSAPTSCALFVQAITDGRHVRDALGMVGGRTVRPPLDQPAWLHSAVMTLSSRGFVLTAPPERPPAGALTIHLTLETAWVASVGVNKIADVVWRVEVSRGGAPVSSKDYRGAANLLNWASAHAELTGLVDIAFARSFDAMSPDLRLACADGGTPSR